MGRLAGRRILITGAASGIGRATAELFAAEGAKLALADRDEKALNAVAATLKAAAFPCDVTDSASVDRAVTGAALALGGLDGLVNSARIMIRGTIEGTDLATWNKVMAVNATGTFIVCKAAGRGTIVTMASATALVPPPSAGLAYVASKGAVISFSKLLATELAPAIRVNTVCPGAVETPMTDGLNISPAMYALKRIAKPAEIAAAILFATSHESAFMTGTTLTLDGGRTYH
ncbi:MAG: SDR family oxidoreductase [Alphaproteobacteria bacterium]|nr:SDR family oxidoreductase [Alphaproteobacteria bacterium]